MSSTTTGYTTPSAVHIPSVSSSQTESIQAFLNRLSDDLLGSLPAAEQLSSSARREIIARYSAVLEGNFIYWMTGAYLAVRTDEARGIILENLLEEVRDSHPLMLRKFTMAANAVPTDAEAMAVNPPLSEVRLFIGRLSAAPILTMMAFFEGLIQRLMPYLEELAAKQGSMEKEYTQVHGVCDVAHSQELFRALELEMVLAADPRDPEEYLYEGVYLLRALLKNILFTESPAVA